MHHVKIDIPAAFKEFFQPARYKIYYGGRGSAKSWSAATALLIIGLQKPTRVVCAREFQNSMEESVHRLLADLVTSYKLPYVVEKYRIYSANGTEFIFKGLSKQDAAAIKSLEGADICWVEEAQNVSSASWQNLIPTLRKDGSEIWVTFNPDVEGAPTYQRFVVNPPPGAIVRHVNWDKNPFFPKVLEAERIHMEHVDPVAYKNVWEGFPRTFSEGAFFREQLEQLDRDKRIGDVAYDSSRRVYTFWDLGWDDSTAIWFVQPAGGTGFNIIDYWEGSNIALPDIVETVLRPKRYNYARHTIPHDGGHGNRQTGKSDRDVLESLGISNVVVQERTNQKDRDVRNIRLVLPKCKFDIERCKGGLAALRAYRQEQDPKTGLWGFKHDWSSHGVDAFRYFAVDHESIVEQSSTQHKALNLPRFRPI